MRRYNHDNKIQIADYNGILILHWSLLDCINIYYNKKTYFVSKLSFYFGIMVLRTKGTKESPLT